MTDREAELAAELATRLRAMIEVLAEVIKGAESDREVGRNALLVAYVLDQEMIGTQRRLAQLMGVTEQRVSEMLKVVRRGFFEKTHQTVDSRLSSK